MKKQKRKILLFSCIAVVLAIAISVGATFAWFVNYNWVGATQYKILLIESAINMYQGLDRQENYNAAPDTLKRLGQGNGEYYTDTDGWQSYSANAYKEEYAFQLIDNKYMLTEESSAMTFSSVEIKDMAPSRIYTYKFEIINYANAATLTCAFDSFKTGNYDNLQVRLVTVTATSETTSVMDETTGETTSTTTTTVTRKAGDWTGFSETGTTLEWAIEDGKTEASTEKSVGGISSSSTYGNHLDFWLQIRMNPTATEPITTAVTLPYFITTLTVKSTSGS